ncbi:MAG: cyclic nucleotide-binding domain-containing protein [Calditrichia bacterium]
MATDSFWGNIFKSNESEKETVREVLKRVPIFDSLDKKELKAVERILHRREYRAGEVVFYEGDPAAGMYIIESGCVKVVFEETQQVLAELNDGEFFGELALLDDSPRSATLIARSDCKMLGFFQMDLLGLVERSPKLGVKIVLRLASVVGERLKGSNQQVQDLRMELFEKLEEDGEKAGKK